MSYIVFSVMHFVKTCQNSQNNSCITNYFGSVHLTSSDTSVDLSGLWGLYWLMFSFSIPLGCCFEPGLWPSCPFIESLFLLPYCRHRSAVVFPPSVQFEILLPARTTAESSAAVEQLQTTEPKLCIVVASKNFSTPDVSPVSLFLSRILKLVCAPEDDEDV